MFETLFGAEMPLAVRFFLAFLIVLGLIGLTAWAVRRFGAGRLGGASARGRQPRLAVIDYASVDGRRRLILVRRDNVEHLLMIGGPTDVVVEPNIVRAVATPRDAAATRPAAGIEALPRAIPLPDNGSNGSWPLQPEATVGLRVGRIEPLPDELPAPPTPPKSETPPPPPRPQRDTLAALADELSTRPTPVPRKPAMNLPRQQPAEPRSTAAQPAIPSPAPATPAAPIVAAAAEAPSAADQTLADMAQRLEAALRKPNAAAETRPAATPRPAPAPAPEQSQPSDAAPTRPPRPSEGRPARPEAKPKESKTTLYDNLEQEMASLLGRPTKT